MPGHQHRSGTLRQTNKKNKRTNASKRSVNRAAGGRVNAKAGGTSVASQSKANRRNTIQQKRTAKKQEVARQKRGMTNEVPRVVGIISLSNALAEDHLCNLISKSADQVTSHGNHVTCKFQKNSLSLVTCRGIMGPTATDPIQAALDLARVCNILVLVVDADVDDTASTQQEWDHLISETGDRILAAIKGQGLPTPLTVLTTALEEEDTMTTTSIKSQKRSSRKRQLDLKKYVGRFATTEFGTDHAKVLEVEQDASLLVRTLCSMSCSPSRWVGNAARPFLVADTAAYNASGELELTGFVRGSMPWDVNGLVHVPHVGTFQCKSITKAALKPNEMTTDTTTLVPTEPETLEMFATADSLEGEQWF
jgi:hypothetical protein